MNYFPKITNKWALGLSTLGIPFYLYSFAHYTWPWRLLLALGPVLLSYLLFSLIMAMFTRRFRMEQAQLYLELSISVVILGLLSLLLAYWRLNTLQLPLLCFFLWLSILFMWEYRGLFYISFTTLLLFLTAFAVHTCIYLEERLFLWLLTT